MPVAGVQVESQLVGLLSKEVAVSLEWLTRHIKKVVLQRDGERWSAGVAEAGQSQGPRLKARKVAALTTPLKLLVLTSVRVSKMCWHESPGFVRLPIAKKSR
jgi:hypothetical protein